MRALQSLRAPRPKSKNPALIATFSAVACLVSLLLGACGGDSAGNTSCSSYRALVTNDRLTTVKAMIDQRHGNDSPAMVDTTELSVDAYCFTHSASDSISGIYNG